MHLHQRGGDLDEDLQDNVILKRQGRVMKAISLKQEKTCGKYKNQPKNKAKTASASTGRNALVRKELADHLKSKRFLILLLLIGGTSFASCTARSAD